MKRNTAEQDHIIDHVGAENWEQVVSEFAGKSQDAVKRDLDGMFPTEDNADLAERIHNAVK